MNSPKGTHSRSNVSLASRAWQIRHNALRMAQVQGQGYIGQSLGVADVLAVSNFHALKYQAHNPEWEERDRFLLAVGHYAIALPQKSGSIINLSSVSAQRGGGIFGGPHYSAAKAGILGLTKAIARELAADNVRANAICPGFINTDITAGKLSDEMRSRVLADIPMVRAGEANEVAGCALFLASDLSAYCKGTEIDVNGGSLIH